MSLKENLNEYSFKIRKTEIWEFFQLYDHLTLLQKDIWRLACWWVKTFPCAIPTQTTLAKKAFCCRKTVNEALNLFETYGWLSKVDRGARRAKRLIIPDHLLNAHQADRKKLRRPEVTREVTPISYPENKMASPSDGSIHIGEWISKKLSHENRLKAALFPCNIYQTVAFQMGKRGIKRQEIQDHEAYFIGCLVKEAKKQNFKPPWRRFYASTQESAGQAKMSKGL